MRVINKVAFDMTQTTGCRYAEAKIRASTIPALSLRDLNYQDLDRLTEGPRPPCACQLEDAPMKRSSA